MRRTACSLFLWGQNLKVYHERLRKANFINGELRRPTGSGTITTASPSDEKILFDIKASSTDDVDEAVQAARDAYNSGPKWGKRATSNARQRALLAISRIIHENATELAKVEALCCGMCYSDALSSVNSSASVFDYFASVVATTPTGNTLPTFDLDDGTQASPRVVRAPIGVCGLITPFNFPLEIGARKIASALACGNTVVWKPPELAPLSALKLGTLLHEHHQLSGGDEIPRGVVNIVHGMDAVGQHISSHGGVDVVGFTGSARVGALIQKAAADSNLKRVNLELGGNAAVIVDRSYSDPGKLVGAVRSVCQGAFGNNGQSCTATRRAYVPKELLLGFVDAAVTCCKRRKLGHALDPNVHQGPMITGTAMHRVLQAVSDAERSGHADLVVGGFRPKFPAGYFVSPTVLVCKTNDCPIVQHELFGPVLCVIPYETVGDAIVMANSTSYGLSANIFSNDMQMVRQCTAQLDSGTVWVNGANVMNGSTPFGGMKLSGYGKDLGVSSLASYSVEKTYIIVH